MTVALEETEPARSQNSTGSPDPAASTKTGPDAVRALAQSGGEPVWLAERRLAAWDSYEAAPLPDRVTHLWRYSEPERFLLDRAKSLELLGSSGESGTDDGLGDNGQPVADEASGNGLAGEITVDNGNVTRLALASEHWDAGVVLSDLRTAATTHEELVQRHLGSIIDGDADGAGKFEALNAALFERGVFLYIPRNVTVEAPIRLRWSVDRDLSAAFPRLLIVLEEGAQATLIDEYGNSGAGSAASTAPRCLANCVVEGSLGANSRLTYVNIQRWGNRTRSHARQRFEVGRDAAVATINLGLGGRYNKSDISNVQAGPNAQAEMIGVVYGSGGQHFDYRTEHIHRASHSRSDMDFKVVLENEAHSVYTGLIRIDLEAAHCEAYQENRNLMLDPTCRAESIPELEILNEEVRCTHGATVGPIDEDQVYYLRTRGLSLREAERLIVEGFFGPALDRIDDESLRTELWDMIDAKIEGRL